MDGNDLKELKELVEFLKANDIAEFDMERQDLKVRLKFAGMSAVSGSGGVDLAQLAQLMAASHAVGTTATPVAQAPHVAVPSAMTVAPEAAADPLAGAHIVKSPIVGTFYEAPAPDAEPFVKLGGTVSNGQVLCIVEAMKLMNEIESDAAGEIVKVFVTAGQPVEYGQPLYAIRK